MSGETTRSSDPQVDRNRPRKALSALPLALRIAVLVLGWIVLLIGIAGLALPGIQGILTIAFGAALLSLSSEWVYAGLRRGLQRWPKVWDRIEKLRAWMHSKLFRLWNGLTRPFRSKDSGTNKESDN